MKYLSILIVILSLNTLYGQRLPQESVLDPQCKKLVYNIIDYNLKMLNTLEPLLSQKNINIKEVFEFIKTNNAMFKTQLLLIDLKLTETQIDLSNLEITLKKAKRKNFWRVVAVGAGSLAAGFVIGSLVVH